MATDPPVDERQRTPGPVTIFTDATKLADDKADRDRAAAEVRDARQDARTDNAWQALVNSERFTKRILAGLLALALVALMALSAMVFDAKLSVDKSGVEVGGGDAPAPVEAPEP